MNRKQSRLIFENPSCYAYFNQKLSDPSSKSEKVPEASTSNQSHQINDFIEFLESLVDTRKSALLPFEARILPSCSQYKTHATKRLEALGKSCAMRAQIPVSSFCCGSAGDRGLLYPELPESACKKIVFRDLGSDLPLRYYAASNTCLMSLEQILGVKISPISDLVWEATSLRRGQKDGAN
jgi:D-lactate dehydrogenase